MTSYISQPPMEPMDPNCGELMVLRMVYMVKNIKSGNGGSNPERLTVVGNTLFFIADDGTHGFELWKSDGASSGTVLVKDIYSGSDSSYPSDLVAVGNTLYFSCSDGSGDSEVWKTNEYEDGTVVAMANASIGVTGSGGVAAVGNTVYFAANAISGNHGMELYALDPANITYDKKLEGTHWSISLSLPEGLTLDTSTGKITGIPTEVIDWTDYTVTLTANDPRGDTYFYNGNGSTWMVKDVWPGTSSGTLLQ